MWTIARPIEWLLCQPQRAANNARVDAERVRIDGIAERRIAEWERRRLEIERDYAGAPDDRRIRAEYFARLRAEHDRYMNERDEERGWRSAAQEAWLDESSRLGRKADRNFYCLVSAVVVATWLEVIAVAVWA